MVSGIYVLTIQLLENAGVPFVVHEHQRVVTMDDVALSLPFPLDASLKTLAFRLSDGDWLIALVPSRSKLDYKKVATAAGVSRKMLNVPSSEVLSRELGIEPGGLGPILPGIHARVLVDVSVVGAGTVYCGVGRNDRTLEINEVDLRMVVNGELADLCRASN